MQLLYRDESLYRCLLHKQCTQPHKDYAVMSGMFCTSTLYNTVVCMCVHVCLGSVRKSHVLYVPAKSRAAPSAMYNTGRAGGCGEEHAGTVNTMQ